MTHKEVIQIDEKGNTIKIFESAIHVEKELGIKAASVRQMCNGRTEFNKQGVLLKYTKQHLYYEKRRTEVLELFKQGATKEQVKELIEISESQLNKMYNNYIQFINDNPNNPIIINSQLRTYLPIADIKKHFRGEKDEEPLYIYDDLSKSEKLIYKDV